MSHSIRSIALSACVAILLALAGCANSPQSPDRPSAPPTPEEIAARFAFYWQYAALAADVYDQQKRAPDDAMLMGSSWLKQQVEKSPTQVKAKYAQLGMDSPNETRTSDVAKTMSNEEIDEKDKETYPVANPDPFQYGRPTSREDCNPKDKEPVVPLVDAVKEFQWQRVPEFRVGSQVRGWAFFVPDMAVDVWRRPRAADNTVIEYAVVFRGTSGGGGWLSNLRSVTAVTPLVWDQYRQARRATQAVIQQATDFHHAADRLLGNSTETRVLVTTVGHSLGAGIASYVYNVVPGVTRAVGFDPSPVDGASSLSLLERSRVMTAGGPRRARGASDDPALDAERFVDSDPAYPQASIYLLYEKGDVLSRFFPCASGPKWGGSGGPSVRCEDVNFLSGNWIRQHSMSRMACMLYLARQGYFDRNRLAASR